MGVSIWLHYEVHTKFDFKYSFYLLFVFLFSETFTYFFSAKKNVGDDIPLIFNCQMGRGRTSTGMIIACLWRSLTVRAIYLFNIIPNYSFIFFLSFFSSFSTVLFQSIYHFFPISHEFKKGFCLCEPLVFYLFYRSHFFLMWQSLSYFFFFFSINYFSSSSLGRIQTLKSLALASPLA